MPKPLSQDLRARVVAAYEGGRETLEVVALMFQIGVATVVRLLSLKRKTGSLDPKPHGGGQRPKLSGSDLELLKALVKDRPDATQAELAEALEHKVHKGVHARMVSRALERIGYSRKKNATPRRAGDRASPAGRKSSTGFASSSLAVVTNSTPR